MYIKKIRQAEANPNQNSSFSCNINAHILTLFDLFRFAFRLNRLYSSMLKKIACNSQMINWFYR